MKILGSNLTINVSDLDKSLKFYEAFGFEVKTRWENFYAQLEGPGILIGLHPTEVSNISGNSGNLSIGFTTDNFDGAKELLDGMAISSNIRKEAGGSFLHFTDPDGTALYFIDPNV